jgi:methyl-accepting chemotaxis protein
MDEKIKDDGLSTADLLKGILIGVGAALAVGGLIALLTTRHRSYRTGMRPDRRLEAYSSDEAIGDIPSELGDTSGSVVETIRAVNRALDTGRQAMETLQDVMENIRGS